MNSKILSFALITTALLLLASPDPARAQGTAFTYQGRLEVGSAPADGNFDLRFGLYTNLTIGNLIGSLETNAAVAVTNGLFTTTLNFDNVFNGAPYWLEIGVRTNGSTNTFTTLAPRQPLTPAPYAITASNLSGVLPASQLSGPLPASVVSGTFSNKVSFTNTANTFSGNGSGLTNTSSATQTGYYFAYDNTVQTLATVNTFQTITFAAVPIGNGWTLASGKLFTVNQTGLYHIEYQVNVQTIQSSSGMSAILRVVNNGASITGSESVVSFPANYLDGISVATKSFLVQLSAGNVLQLQFTANNSTDLISGTDSGEFLPSASMTILRIK